MPHDTRPCDHRRAGWTAPFARRPCSRRGTGGTPPLFCDAALVIGFKDEEIAEHIQETPFLKNAEREGFPVPVCPNRRCRPPVTVRHGLKRSQSELSVPTRACRPSETTSRALYASSDGISALYVCSCWNAFFSVAASSAAFFNSKRQGEGHSQTPPHRRVCWRGLRPS